MLKNPSHILAAVAWASVFAEAWMLVTRNVPADLLSWGMWSFFLVVAVLASALSMAK